MSRQPLAPAALRRALAVRDLTDAALGPHAVQLLVRDVIAALRDAWDVPVVVRRASPVVDVADNYDRLGYAPEAAARDARYSRYVDERRMLRAHTSALIPGALRDLRDAGHDDVLVACPGLVYRRDAIDRLHVGEPHQLDLWRVRRGALGPDDLVRMVALVVAALLPGRAHRCRPALHPYTEHGLEIEVEADGTWVELGECGLAAPRVLAGAGVDPAEHAGLAMGLGLDRALMLRKGIGDIRLLRSADPRVAGQLLDLEPYRPVSSMPPVRRDLSLAVAADVDAELLGDRAREALGAAAEAVEAIEVIARTPARDLPPAAVERLGLRPGQVNVLVRLVLRHPTETLTAAEANGLRNVVYAALHEGERYEWAAA